MIPLFDRTILILTFHQTNAVSKNANIQILDPLELA